MSWLILCKASLVIAFLFQERPEYSAHHFRPTTEDVFIKEMEGLLRKYAEYGVDMDVTWESGNGEYEKGGLIDCAAHFGYKRALQRLIDFSGGLTYDSQDESPLHFAVDAGNVEVLPLLVKSGCPIDGQRDGALIPIEIAILNGDIAMANALANLGANPPLHVLIAMGRIQVAMGRAHENAIVDSTDWAGRKSLHYAAAIGNQDSITWLLHRDAEVDCADNDVGRTALHYAAMNGHVKICRLLIENGAHANSKGFYRMTPLHLAAASGHADICELLITAGARVNERDLHTGLPLHYAVWGKHFDTVRLLLQRGSDVNLIRSASRWDSSASPLHIAAQVGAIEVAKVLLDERASIDLANEDGDTPLHTAVKVGNLEFAKFLVQKGANRNLRNSLGKIAAETVDSNKGNAPSWLTPSGNVGEKIEDK